MNNLTHIREVLHEVMNKHLDHKYILSYTLHGVVEVENVTPALFGSININAQLFSLTVFKINNYDYILRLTRYTDVLAYVSLLGKTEIVCDINTIDTSLRGLYREIKTKEK